MILTLIGPDDYRREKRKHHLVEEFRKKYGLGGAERFVVSRKEDREKLHELIYSPSLFSQKQLALLEEVFEVEDKKFLVDLKQASENKTIWVFISEREKAPAALKFITQKPAVLEEFPFLTGEAWRQFVAQEGQSRKLQFQPETFQLLVAMYQDNTWRLTTELDKLSCKGGCLRPEDLNPADSEKAFNLWGIMSGLRSSFLNKRLYALEKVFESQEPAAKVFNILAVQPGISVRDFADWDADVKSGRLEYEEILLSFVLGRKAKAVL